MFFGKQKFGVKQLNKFIFDVKQLKINKFTFDVKQLKMNRFIKSISDLISSTTNATLEVPWLGPSYPKEYRNLSKEDQFPLLKVNGSVYIASRTYQFC